METIWLEGVFGTVAHPNMGEVRASAHAKIGDFQRFGDTDKAPEIHPEIGRCAV
jgi:hypothetical protein